MDMKIPRKISIILSFIIVAAVLTLPFIFKTKRPVSTIVPDTASIQSNGIRTVSFPYPAMIGATPISIAIANTEAEQEEGLSNTEMLGYDQGMLFVFPKPTIPAFWMKQMQYPLDIIWIDQDKIVVGVNKNLAPETYPKTFAPKVPVMYALEVPGGFFDSRGIKVGDLISF